MGVRFTHTFYSQITGQQYKVEITDSSYSGAITTIELGGEGFRLQYFQEGDEIYAPIKDSQCEVFLKITQDGKGAALLSWLQGTLLNGDEDKYNVLIYKGSDLWWMGVILPDIANHADSSIGYDWTITAKDGINRLKNFDFNVEFNGGSHSIASIKDIIYECLKSTPLYKSTTQTLLFSTCVEWYEDQMPSRTDSKDPLRQTYIDTWAFTKIEDSERVRIPIYDVLEQICKAWGMRLIFSNGIFRFLQVNAYEQITPNYERFYRRSDGAYSSNAALTDEIEVNDGSSLPKVLSGNQWAYFPPLKSAYIKFPFDNLNMLNLQNSIPYTEELPNNIAGGTGVRLVFTTSINVNITDVAFSMANGAFVVATINLNLGTSYVLKKDVLGALNSWSTTLTDDAQFYKETRTRTFQFDIAFVTDEIPSGVFATNGFEIDITECKDKLTGASLTFRANRVTGSTSLIYAVSQNGNDAFFSYEVQNTLTTINSYDIEEPDAVMGEMYFTAFFGGLYTGDTSSWSPSTGLWTIKGSGTQYNFILLRLREIMAAQITAIPKYQGGIVGSADINPHTLVTYDGDSYILNGATYSAGSEVWDGEWFQVDYDRVSVEDIEDEENNEGGDTNNQLRRSIGDVSTQLDNLGMKGGVTTSTVFSTNTTLQAITQIALVDDAVTITLPPAADWIAFGGNSITITIKNIAAVGDNVTIDGSGSETIDGSTTKTLGQYESATLISNGTNIFII